MKPKLKAPSHGLPASHPLAEAGQGGRTKLAGQVSAQRKVSRKFRADLDAHSLARVHPGRNEVGLARAGTVTRKRERSPASTSSINGINIPMNIYSINPSSEPGEARMRGTQGRNAHGRHGECREPAAQAGSLPCKRRRPPARCGQGGLKASRFGKSKCLRRKGAGIYEVSPSFPGS